MSSDERVIPAGERRIERARATHGMPVRRAPIAVGALAIGALAAWGGQVPQALLALVRQRLAGAGDAAMPGSGNLALGEEALRSLVMDVASAAWPALLGGVVGAALGALLQTGFRLRAPASGGRARLHSPAAAAAGAVARLAWAIVLGAAAASAIAMDWPRVAAMPQMPLSAASDAAGRVVLDAVLAALGAGSVLAIADVALARWRWARALQMTPEEAREERRSTEADPAVRGRRQAAAQRLRAASAPAGAAGHRSAGVRSGLRLIGSGRERHERIA